MRKLIYIFALLFTIPLFAQQQITGNKANQNTTYYGSIVAEKGLQIPSETTNTVEVFGSVRISTLGVLQVYDGSDWVSVGSSATLQEVTTNGSTTTEEITARGYVAVNSVSPDRYTQVRPQNVTVVDNDEVSDTSGQSISFDVTGIEMVGSSLFPVKIEPNPDQTESISVLAPDQSGTLALEENSVPYTGATSSIFLESNKIYFGISGTNIGDSAGNFQVNANNLIDLNGTIDADGTGNATFDFPNVKFTSINGVQFNQGGSGNLYAVTSVNGQTANGSGQVTIPVGSVENNMTASTTVAPSKTAVKNYIDQHGNLTNTTTSGSAITGTTSEVIAATCFIPANTVTTGNLFLKATFNKTGTAGTAVVKVYTNTVNSLSGTPVTLGTYTVSNASNLYIPFRREFDLKPGNIIAGYPETASNIDGMQASTNTPLSATFTTTVDNYIIVTYQPASSGDSALLSAFKVKFEKSL